jgi:hypothetical protein
MSFDFEVRGASLEFLLEHRKRGIVAVAGLQEFRRRCATGNQGLRNGERRHITIGSGGNSSAVAVVMGRCPRELLSSGSKE